MRLKILAPGTLINGFCILEKIASGNMGTVYSATQVNLNRKVAIKVLFEHTVQDQDFLRGFFREAQAAAAFTHQNIVQAYDVGHTEDNLYYFAMELVDGGDVLELIKEKESIIYKDALPLLTGIAEGLHYGNSTRQLTHGDLKPANILITRQGEAKLADLGLARMGGEIQGESDGIMLTPMYAAPEMILGEWKSGDPRADIYSFGATLYHMLAGHPPFEDKSFNAILRMQVEEEHIPLKKAKAKIPQGVSDFVDHLLEKDLSKRPQNWAEVIEALQQLKLKASVYQNAADKKTKSKVFDRAKSDNNKSKKTLIAVIAGFFLLATIALTLINIDQSAPKNPKAKQNTSKPEAIPTEISKPSSEPENTTPVKKALPSKPLAQKPVASEDPAKEDKALRKNKKEIKQIKKALEQTEKKKNEAKEKLSSTPAPPKPKKVTPTSKAPIAQTNPTQVKLVGHFNSIASHQHGDITAHIKKISTLLHSNTYAQNLSIHFFEALESMKSTSERQTGLSDYNDQELTFVENKIYGPLEQSISMNSKEAVKVLADISEEFVLKQKSTDKNILVLYALTNPNDFRRNKVPFQKESAHGQLIQLILSKNSK